MRASSTCTKTSACAAQARRCTTFHAPCVQHRHLACRNVSAAGRKYSEGKQQKEAKKKGQSTGPTTPPTDPSNEEFVIFISTDERPQWLPVSIVTGGAQANTMVKAAKGKIGDGVYGSTLKNNIGRTLYEQKATLLEQLRGPQGPSGYEQVEDLIFGFKVRDKSVPDEWWKPENVIEVPPQEEIPEGPVDTVKKGWSSLADRITGRNRNKKQEKDEQLDDIIDSEVEAGKQVGGSKKDKNLAGLTR